jgi:hypothetical protein
MEFTVVCVDVRCNKNFNDRDPIYRIFLDDHLVMERRFWPTTPDFYIQEQLTLHNDNCEHTLRIKNVFPERGEIYVHNLNFFDGTTRTVLPIEYSYQLDAYYFKIIKR